ncbi:MAG: prepilin-type N-terminal cleavage/methylation domain-containing protein [Magnetococcales bacterium]|nr:prepilin-type N-terminal cleavage/methylation domain-containing protein [Magnetococcales bacterium]
MMIIRILPTGRFPVYYRGFTLLEILFSLTILGMLTLLTPPLLLAVIPSLRLEEATKKSSVFLRQAQKLSIITNSETVVTINTQEKWFRMGNEGKYEPFPDEISVQLTTPESEQIDEVSARIRFFPDGGSSGGQLIFKLDDWSNFVIVDWLTGRVRVNVDTIAKE